MTAGDERAAVHFGRRLSPNVPLRRGRDRRLGRDRARELLSFGQLAIGRGLAAGRDNPAVARGQRRPIDLPLRGCLIDEHLAGGGRGARQLPAHPRRALRSERAGVVRRQVGVRHHHRDRAERQPQLVGDRLSERRADVLADLGLAGVCRDASLLVDVQPGREVGCVAARLGAAPGFLREHRAGWPPPRRGRRRPRAGNPGAPARTGSAAPRSARTAQVRSRTLKVGADRPWRPASVIRRFQIMPDPSPCS